MPKKQKKAGGKRRALAVAEAAPAAPDRPPLRYMTIVAQDPSVRRNGHIVTARVAVPAEELMPGPVGYRVQVVDYDATSRNYYDTHDLPKSYADEPDSWQHGDDSLVNDFRFHAQNVYALVMRTLARFEFALGRRVGWSFDTHQIKIAPHGMHDANAFYSPTEEGLVFGYFDGLSGSPVYTSLSHDVIVHETTHALLDALRQRYLVPSNPDQAAFHEGLSDVVALLSVFALPQVVEHLLQMGSGRADVNTPKPVARGNVDKAKLIVCAECEPEALRESALFGLADQMGSEMQGVRGEPLRKSAEIEPSPDILETEEFSEPHRRGEVFVAAVMRAFINAWSARIFASGAPGQKKFPLGHVAEEGADIADALATMWIRAIDYMPPVHLTFRDALSAALTSDTRVRPDDTRVRLRHYLKQSFAEYGILPVTTKRRSDCWDPPPPGICYDRVRFDSLRSDKDEVFRFLWENRKPLKLRTDAFTQVLSVDPCVRVGVDGFVLRETVAQYYQRASLTPAELAHERIKAPKDLVRRLGQELRASKRRAPAGPGDGEGGAAGNGHEEREGTLPALYGGGVLIFDEYGRLKYHIHNDVFGGRQGKRLEYLWNAGLLRVKGENAGYRAARLSTMHRLRAIDARKWPSEGW